MTSAMTTQRHLHGFSVLEVMVALIIISVGLLGIAKMQALAIASTTTSRTRSIAALEAASLASAMRADRAYWSLVTADPNVSISGTTITASDTNLTSAVLACNDTGAPCTIANIAAKDLNDWATEVSTQISGSTTTINCQIDAIEPVSCTIVMTWTEKQVASDPQQVAAAAGTTPTPTNFILHVDP